VGGLFDGSDNHHDNSCEALLPDRSITAYQAVLRKARERLKWDGVLILHRGKSRKSDKSDALVRVSAPWFGVIARFDENVTHTESPGFRDKGTVTSHQYLVLA
jgi:hypothetical protein